MTFTQFLCLSALFSTAMVATGALCACLYRRGDVLVVAIPLMVATLILMAEQVAYRSGTPSSTMVVAAICCSGGTFAALCHAFFGQKEIRASGYRPGANLGDVETA